MRIEKGVLVFADTDFLSSFLRVGLKDFLINTLKDNFIKVPYSVALEICDSHMQNLINEFQYLTDNGIIEILPQIPTDSEKFKFMMECCALKDSNYPEFGEGELEALAHAYIDEGYIASNNLKHIIIPCQDYNIKYFSTKDVLLKAYKEKIKTEQKLNVIWNLIRTVQLLPNYSSFTEFLEKGV